MFKKKKKLWSCTPTFSVFESDTEIVSVSSDRIKGMCHYAGPFVSSLETRSSVSQAARQLVIPLPPPLLQLGLQVCPGPSSAVL